MQVLEKNILNPPYESYLNLKASNPKLKERELAKLLGITEAQLVASKVGIDAVQLNNDFKQILMDLHRLGELLAITRNADVVHERKGVYNNISFPEPASHGIGLVVNADIDLRFFMNSWEFAFAVNEAERKSIQIFDVYGTAVHKIYLTENSNKAEYYNLIEKHASASQDYKIEIKPALAKRPVMPNEMIDVNSLKTEWQNLKDTHDFYMLLRKYKVEREQAFNLVGSDLAYKVDIKNIRTVLEKARDKNCEIMVFVGNLGCLQIHTGPVEKLMEYGKWYNVLDPMFNLHVNEDALNSAWVVKKPSVDGDIHSLEFFDKDGELLLTFFGKRKPGIPELQLWREIVKELQ